MKKTILWVLLGWPITWLAAQPAVLDYRPLQSPVKNQGYRNTCTGFAVAACLEVLPGVPADVSEQHLYAGLKMLEYQKTDPVDQGGLLNLYPQTIARYGVLPESRMPYDSTQRIFSDTDHNLVQVVRESQSGPVSMLMQAGKAKITVDPQDCEVGEFDEKVSVAYIKKLLAQGIKAIGVGYYVNDYWFDWDKKPGLLITPDSVGGFVDTSRNITTFKALKQQYGEGAFAQINSLFGGPTGRRWYYSSNRPPQGHAVTIVGYNRDGFIIKNSWGSGWGHQGYATVSYDYHRLFAKRMVAIKKVRFTPQAQLPLTPLADLRLKLVPVNGMRGGIQVSLFCMNDGYDPLITQVEYAVYQLNNGQKTLLDKRLSLPGLVEYDPSFTTVLLKDKGLPPLPKLPRPQLIIEAVLTGGSTAQRITQTFRHIQWANTEYRSEVK